jgi:hypothetical protein
MMRFVCLLVIFCLIVWLIIVVAQRYRKAHPKKVVPIGGAHEMIPSAVENALDDVSQNQTKSTVEDLRQYLEHTSLSHGRKDRGGRKYIIGQNGADFVIIVRGREPSSPLWRYVCTGGTPPVLWGAKRPAAECALPDNSNTAGLNKQKESEAEILLDLLRGSSPYELS